MSDHTPERTRFDVADITERYPPRFWDGNKKAVYEHASRGTPDRGTIEMARWPERPVPRQVEEGRPVALSPDVFPYAAAPEGECHWYLNFADEVLFAAYASSLLAQDELQVLEHPALGSVQNACRATTGIPTTLDSAERPTPITLTGVPRRLALDTSPNAARGRPGGLYGNAFRSASTATVLGAVTLIEPPTLSNILAIRAPSYGRGVYSPADLDYILATAYTGFAAAHDESVRLAGPDVRTVIHTGFWGCGAYGGNRSVMIFLQALAGDLAGTALVFHTVTPGGMPVTEAALGDYRSELSRDRSTAGLLTRLEAKGHRWGVSNGT
jgi:hypothetical protein